MYTKIYVSFNLVIISIYLLTIFSRFRCQEQKIIEPKKPEPQKSSDDLLKTLSRSKASVWVDTNKGNIFSTSLGSSHLEKDPKANDSKVPIGRSSNMLLTLLLQPGSQTAPIQAVSAPNADTETSLKPILLLLQQQQDLSEILLEKQEKIEKMNVHLQQQIKHQHLLIVELLEQLKMFLEIINSPNYSGAKAPTEEIDKLKQRYSPQFPNGHSTSATSSANAVVTAPKKQGLDNTVITTTESNSLQNQSTTQTNMSYRRDKPILATSNSETTGLIRRN